MTYTCTKTFDCVSTAHRNWRAKNNPDRNSVKCSFIHGYTKSFTFVFGCSELDQHNWVYDYGTTSSNVPRVMTLLKEFITETLDHAVTTDSSDPLLSKMYEMHDLGLIKLVVIPDENGQSGSIEGLCRYFYNKFNPLLQTETNGRVWIESITISEHHKNSSTFTASKEVFVETPKDIPISNPEIVREILEDELWKKQNEDFAQTKKSFEKHEKTDSKVDFMNDVFDKYLTKENIEMGLHLLKLNPKYRAISTLILNADDIKEAVLKNPVILELIKGLIKKK